MGARLGPKLGPASHAFSFDHRACDEFHTPPLTNYGNQLMRLPLELSANLHQAVSRTGDGPVPDLSSLPVRRCGVPELPAVDAENPGAARAAQGTDLQLRSWTAGTASYLCS